MISVTRGAADRAAARLQRAMQHKPLLAGHDLDPIHAGVEITQPETRPSKHRREGRQHFEILFIDERQFVLVHRVAAEADPERVENSSPWCTPPYLLV